MAFYAARSGVTRSGVTRSGAVDKNFGLRIGGVDQLGKLQRKVQFRISTQLDGASSTTMRLSNASAVMMNATPPTQWQDVVFLYGTAADDYFWGGTIVNTRSAVWERYVEWELQAADWSWLLDRYKLVTARYASQGVNTIMRAIIDNFTNGGFRPGYCPSTLGDIDEIVFDGVPVSQALGRLAKAAQAFFRITPDKRIDIAQVFPEGNPLAVSNTTRLRQLAYEESGALVATRVRFIGRGVRATVQVAPGSTVLFVEDASPFAPGGGMVRVEECDVAYTGIDLVTDTLTGCTGLSQTVPVGSEVRVLVVAEDLAAQAALAAALGAGRSGIAEASFQDPVLSDAEARGRAALYLAFYKDRIPATSFVVESPHYKVGKLVTFGLTDPMAITGDQRIQQVSIYTEEDILPTQKLPRLQLQVNTRLGRRANVLDVIVPR